MNERLNNPDKALNYYLKALSINLNHGDKIFLSPAYNYIGNIYIHSTSDEIKNVYLLDFGYSMIKDTRTHSSSPY